MEQIIEIFKDIADYSGKYQISNLGRVKSVKTGKILKPSLSVRGYMVQTLSSDGKLKQHLIHKLTAEAFIENPNNLPNVDHRNGDRTDNSLTNLRWVSIRENNLNRSGHRANTYTSKYFGVIRRRSKWSASIWAGKKIFLGNFGTEIEAAKAYDQARIELGLEPLNNILTAD